MPVETIYTLGESQITVSGGGQLSGESQGSGVHLNGRVIMLNSNAWEPIDVFDTEANFQDSDGSQTLNGDQTMDGTPYTDGSRVEAEYGITVQDPDGNTYQMIAFNINESPSPFPSFGTIEGLAFVGGVGGFPPRDVPLTVIGTQEGPSNPYASLATPPCFVAGSMIATPSGQQRIETLQAGAQVLTRDHGAQVLRWIGTTFLPHSALLRRPEFRPVVIDADSLGPDTPGRTTWVSPQHRVLIAGWKAELFFGTSEILVPATKLVDDKTIRSVAPRAGVSYVHLLFKQHEIVCVDGLWSESLFVDMAEQSHKEGAAEAVSLFANMPRTRIKKTARPSYSDKRTAVFDT